MLRDVKTNQRIKIEFKIDLSKTLPEEIYHISALAKGKSEARGEVQTQSQVSNFLVKLVNIVNLSAVEVMAKEEEIPNQEFLFSYPSGFTNSLN